MVGCFFNEHTIYMWLRIEHSNAIFQASPGLEIELLNFQTLSRLPRLCTNSESLRVAQEYRKGG